MKKTLSLFFLITAVYLLPSIALAQQYGVGAPAALQLVVNKLIMHPKSGIFVENLTPNDPKVAAQEVVTFKATVTNSANAKLSGVKLTDNLPQFVNFGTGPGKFDEKSKTLTIDVGDLAPSETKTFTFTTKVVSQDKLPADKATVCVVNQAVVTASDTAQTAQDNAQFCIAKQVLGVPTKGGLRVFPPPTVSVTPPTGPEMLALAALIPSGLAGIFLRRKSQMQNNLREGRG